jgi:hypothetical protein
MFADVIERELAKHLGFDKFHHAHALFKLILANFMYKGCQPQRINCVCV